MSEEHKQQQQQQQQQKQQQQQQQQQSHKSISQQQKLNKSEDVLSTTSPPIPPRKINIHELCNQDFVSRLLAATPPYLYSAPVGPNNFFFSDMLRALVQAKNRESARNLQLQQQQAVVMARRPRKRAWSHHRSHHYEHNRVERKEIEEKQSQIGNRSPNDSTNCHASPVSGCRLLTEKPLELTNKRFFHVPLKYNKIEPIKNGETIAKSLETRPDKDSMISDYEGNVAAGNTTLGSGGGGAVDAILQSTPPVASLPPQDLVLPPPPPIWYPPLYSPYGLDPLHFFIDLRVSGGHVYDRKKEIVSPLGSADNNGSTSLDHEKSGLPDTVSPPLSKHRHGSAFTVPVPRSNELAKAAAASAAAAAAAAVGSGNAMNLSANKYDNYTKYYDLGESKENRPGLKSNTNYMLQHLPRLYTQIAARDLISAAAASSTEFVNTFGNDNKSEPDCDAESDGDGRGSSDYCEGRITPLERDIDVEIIESTKRRLDGGSSHSTSPDESVVTQID